MTSRRPRTTTLACLLLLLIWAPAYAQAHPRPDSLFSGYSAVSPHWPHIRTMMTDFFGKWAPNERSWAAGHYDYVMSGDAAAWKRENSGIRHYRYVLLQATTLPRTRSANNIVSAWYDDMVRWYAVHPHFRIESAFLHQARQPADSAHRLKPWGWDTYTWIINPADSGLIAYSENRFQYAAKDEDGLFIDSQGSGDLSKNIKGSAEFPADTAWPPESGAYYSAYARLLSDLAQALRPKGLMINTAGYRFKSDVADIRAAGATHMEKANNPLSSDLPATWTFIDTLLGDGIFVDLVNALDYADMKAVVRKDFGGTVDSAYHRIKMAELASYYMVVPPTPVRLALQTVNMWDRPMSSVWIRAQEANIGHPSGRRAQLTQGVPAADPTGQKVLLFARDFDRALVLFRAQTGWGAQRYGDSTAIRVALPSGEVWLPLNADGSCGAPVTSASLRNAEAAIFIKQGTIR
jgi:hypothetical protein